MIELTIKVKPNGKRQTVTPLDQGTWETDHEAPPTGGKANQKLIALLANQSFGQIV